MIDDATTVRLDWIGEERAQPGVWRELGRLGRRARRRWPRTLALAVACTALAVAVVAKRPRTYASRIAFRVSESELEVQTAPKTNANLRDYVSTVVFSNSRLAAVIKEHGLYAAVMARDPSIAIESMREDLDVEVWRNLFELPRSSENAVRSARVAITYHGRDREKVYAVVRELGQLIIDSEQHSRLSQAETALRLAEDTVEQARAFMSARKAELVDADVRRRTARTPDEGLAALIVERDLEKAVPRAERLLELAERKREQAYLRVQLEKRALGVRWELIDPGRIEAEGPRRSTILTAVGIVVFCLSLPLCAIGVGAFDPRVYDLADVRRLGLPTVGAVRHFDGDNAGALTERLLGRATIPPS